MNQAGVPESEFWPAQDGSTPVEPRSYDKRALAVLEEVLNSPLPEGTEVIDTPQYVQNSLAHVRKLSLDQQSKIAYYRKNGEWFIDINGIKISVQNESAEHNPEKGVYVDKGNTYFSQSAAQSNATSKGRILPTNALWREMADFLGWYNQIRDILQIPLNGWVDYDIGLQGVGGLAGVWSADHGQYLGIYSDFVHVNDINIGDTSLYSVRLLDN